VATLVKAGLIGTRLQNRDVTDPRDAQLRAVFAGAREFNRAEFALLPEVDWREAAGRSSALFGVHGGDSFEQTAAIARDQARLLAQEAGQLATRCRDNGLPSELAVACQQVAESLREAAQEEDPNARLRQFLELPDSFNEQVSIVHQLHTFPFEEYRNVREFVRLTGDWAMGLSGEAQNRWQSLQGELQKANLVIDRWETLKSRYAFLLGRYQADYVKAHHDFQVAVREAVETLRRHEAFQRVPDQAERALEPLKVLGCSAEEPSSVVALRCPFGASAQHKN
jgi:hypothetical protein